LLWPLGKRTPSDAEKQGCGNGKRQNSGAESEVLGEGQQQHENHPFTRDSPSRNLFWYRFRFTWTSPYINVILVAYATHERYPRYSNLRLRESRCEIMVTKAPTNSVIRRIFRIRFAEKQGTAFALDVNGRQYLITAKHLLDEFNDSGNLGLFFKSSWLSLPAQLVGHSPDVDLSVVKLEQRLTPAALPLDVIDQKNPLAYGQDVYFLGFPYGNFGPEFDNGQHIPFVKKAVVSLIIPP